MTDTYVALDLETTGLNPKLDRIIEVGAVRVEKGREKDTFQSLVNPFRRLDERVAALTGITQDMLEGAPAEEEVLPKLLSFIGGDILVGHRILFDFSFIRKAAVNRKLPFEKNGIDTLKLSRKFLPDLQSRRLADLCTYYRIEHTAHRALGDAQATSQLYLKLAELFYKGNEEAFLPQPLRYQTKRETSATKPQKERLYKLLEQHRIVIDYSVDKLTRSEASRITDRILAEYGR